MFVNIQRRYVRLSNTNKAFKLTLKTVYEALKSLITIWLKPTSSNFIEPKSCDHYNCNNSIATYTMISTVYIHHKSGNKDSSNSIVVKKLPPSSTTMSTDKSSKGAMTLFINLTCLSSENTNSSTTSYSLYK